MNANVFEELELLSLKLLELIVPNFSDSEVREVQEFIDVGEYLLALETFVAIIEDSGMPLKIEVEATIVRLADRMNVESEKLLKGITSAT